MKIEFYLHDLHHYKRPGAENCKILTRMLWILVGSVGAALIVFFVIARAGRKLRTARVLPGEATRASLHTKDGKEYSIDGRTDFYIGAHPGNEVVLTNAPRDYAVCIFYHRRRFAFQTLSSSRGIRVNEEEIMAGYLTNGDILEIAGESFVFRSYS